MIWWPTQYLSILYFECPHSWAPVQHTVETAVINNLWLSRIMKFPISSTAVPLLLYLQLGGPYLLTFLKKHIFFHRNPGNFELIRNSSPPEIYTFFRLEKLDFPMIEIGKPLPLENISQVASCKHQISRELSYSQFSFSSWSPRLKIVNLYFVSMPEIECQKFSSRHNVRDWIGEILIFVSRSKKYFSLTSVA